MHFKDIFTKSKQSPKCLISDKGQEFNARVVQQLMKDKNILYFPTQNETKASVSERAIKSVKTKIYRYLTFSENYSYLPILQDVAKNYNKTYHRTIGTTPVDVKDTNEEEVRLSIYYPREKADGKSLLKKRYKFKVGDYVRISHLTTKFTRAYDETFTGELFTISKRYYRGTIPVYRLRDLQNEEIKGTFYQSELQGVDINPDQTWKVEKVLNTKGKGPNKQYYVKWKYYPKKFNSWVKASDIE